VIKKRKPTPLEPDATTGLGIDPQWYKDAVIYQLHVRAFRDSDADGIGDFRGLTQKLDYLQDLGVTALWLLPFYPSPLKDDGYDISNYTEVNAAYGRLRDFKELVREAHARGLRVITELVINHTSDQHPWFQRARQAKAGSPERDFYVWSDTPEKYQDARIIFKDFETSNWAWDPVAKAYYWHRFYSHQPDLNFDNPRVQRELFDALDYWLNLGVDGLRLDAVPYLYEREGTNCENLPQTHAFLKKLRKHVDERFPGRMLLAEANQWPEDAIAYFGDGDECHTAFHFPVMPRLFMAIQMEDRFPIVDILQQTPPIPPECQWLIFLRNHDELTLEMVTDEERDYMYRVYARDRQARINLGIRRRLAPLLGNNRRKIELMNGLLCSLPGTPVIYYGDEIGMGDNIYLGDRHGVRTPMQWSPDRNAGFSDGNPQRLYLPVIIDSEYLFETVNVETQQKNPSSLLWWMKRLIALRQHYAALRKGSLELLAPENSKILAYTREYEGECVLMVANMSRFVQFAELDLSRFAGRRPMEMFGQSPFPTIIKSPYSLTLAPHAFYWFALETEAAASIDAAAGPTTIRVALSDGWAELLQGRAKRSLEALLRRELPTRAWFRNVSKPIQSLQIYDAIPLGRAKDKAAPCVSLLRVEYVEGEPEGYLLPLAKTSASGADGAMANPADLIAQLQKSGGAETETLFDAALDPKVAKSLWELMVHRRRFKGAHGDLVGWCTPALSDAAETLPGVRVVTLGPEPRNADMVFNDRYILKMFRRLESGINPDFEIGRFLSRDSVNFPNVLPIVGAVEYRRKDEEQITIGLMREYDPNTVSAWQFAQDSLGRFFEQVMAQPIDTRPSADTATHVALWDLAGGDAPALAKDLLGAFLEWSSLLGRRTGEMHAALASDHKDPDFAPEPFSQFRQRSLYQSARKLTLQTFQSLRGRFKSLPADIQPLAREVLDRERVMLEKFRAMVGPKIEAQRIRCHGDYHLGHVLYTGKDFLIVDFEGEPTLPLSARRIKRSPIDDVAGMVHSFQYAASHALLQLPKRGIVSLDAIAEWQKAANFWSLWSGSAFLRSYGMTSAARLLPAKRDQWDLLLQFHLLEEAVYELRDIMATAPEQIAVPVRRILELSAV
jgi:maltose alpha-D-glucosyltransferase / alpha-amylase